MSRTTTVDLSNNLKVRIGDEMFYTCSKLSKIVLPNNILEIGESAFYGCSSLKI
ncbi:MAG: leucine-rich repeat protein [Bacteroides sp.]